MKWHNNKLTILIELEKIDSAMSHHKQKFLRNEIRPRHYCHFIVTVPFRIFFGDGGAKSIYSHSCYLNELQGASKILKCLNSDGLT